MENKRIQTKENRSTALHLSSSIFNRFPCKLVGPFIAGIAGMRPNLMERYPQVPSGISHEIMIFFQDRLCDRLAGIAAFIFSPCHK